MMQRILQGELPYVRLWLNLWNRGKYGYLQIRVEWYWDRSVVTLDQQIASWANPFDEIPF